jgi:hypothetical protein
VNAMPSIRIWIVRRGNGRAQATPSPVHVRPEESFRIRNLTQEQATVVFPEGTIKLDMRSIPPKGVATATVIAAAPTFFEYEVELSQSGNYVDGGSKPGVIVDG